MGGGGELCRGRRRRGSHRRRLRARGQAAHRPARPDRDRCAGRGDPRRRSSGCRSLLPWCGRRRLARRGRPGRERRLVMTIRKGEQWGTPTTRPTDLVVAGSDAELAALVARDPGGEYGLRGGDLYRSLGAPPERETMQRLPLDALMVRADDGDEVLCVAHVVARNGWWTGPILAIENCGYVGHWNVAPRAHPNDGRFDVVEVSGSMSVRQRLQARRRLGAGTHVPHPDITIRTAESGEWRFGRPTNLYLDGVQRGRCTRLMVTIAPDHFSIYT